MVRAAGRSGVVDEATPKGIIVPGDLRVMFAEVASLRDQIDQWEADLAAAKARFNALLTEQIPDLMMDKYSSPETDWVDKKGRRWNFKCDDVVTGSLPSKDQEKKAAAIAWLEDHEGGDLIKTEVALDFNREQRDEAIKLAKQLEKRGLPVNVNSGVHPQTLQAWARERLRAGEEVAAELLGLWIGRKVKPKIVQLPVQRGVE